jgi:hypothetical protein
MKIEVSVAEHGGPRVAWVQSTSETGETVGSRKAHFTMALGLGGGLLLGIAMGDPKMLFAGPLFGLMAALWSMGQDAKERGPDKDDAAPILTKQYCEASIVRDGDMLLLDWSLKGKRMTDRFTIPLADAGELIVGSMNDWFAGKGDVRKFHESFVIVMPLSDGRVLRLADHAGPQSEIAELHGVLSQVLIDPRMEMLRALGAEIRQRERGARAEEIPDTF